jgi:hypothetical protein
MYVQISTPRGIITSSNITNELVEWKKSIQAVLCGESTWIAFESAEGNGVLLSENIIKDSIITFIDD